MYSIFIDLFDHVHLWVFLASNSFFIINNCIQSIRSQCNTAFFYRSLNWFDLDLSIPQTGIVPLGAVTVITGAVPCYFQPVCTVKQSIEAPLCSHAAHVQAEGNNPFVCVAYVLFTHLPHNSCHWKIFVATLI